MDVLFNPHNNDILDEIDDDDDDDQDDGDRERRRIWLTAINGILRVPGLILMEAVCADVYGEGREDTIAWLPEGQTRYDRPYLWGMQIVALFLLVRYFGMRSIKVTLFRIFFRDWAL